MCRYIYVSSFLMIWESCPGVWAWHYFAAAFYLQVGGAGQQSLWVSLPRHPGPELRSQQQYLSRASRDQFYLYKWPRVYSYSQDEWVARYKYYPWQLVYIFSLFTTRTFSQLIFPQVKWKDLTKLRWFAVSLNLGFFYWKDFTNKSVRPK